MARSDIAPLARRVGVSEGAFRRLFDRTQVVLEKGGTPLNIGFQLMPFLEERKLDEALCEQIVGTVSEFRTASPKVYSWIIRGGFDPTRLPKDIDKVHYQHAVRVSGRLRAQLLRSFHEGTSTP